jgi:hypothetical protein
MRGVRKATPQGHHAAVAADQCVGVLSAGAVTARVLETPEPAVQRMSGARPARVFDVRPQMGRQGPGELLDRGHSGPECGGRTTVVTIVHTRQSWRLRVRAAGVRVSAVRALMKPPAADDAWFACPWAERPHGQQA